MMGEFIVLAAIIKVVVDRVKARFISIDGDLINLVAAAIGVGAAVLFQVQAASEVFGLTIEPVLDYVVTGIAIGLGASFLNDAIAAIGSE